MYFGYRHIFHNTTANSREQHSGQFKQHQIYHNQDRQRNYFGINDLSELLNLW